MSKRNHTLSNFNTLKDRTTGFHRVSELLASQRRESSRYRKSQLKAPTYEAGKFLSARNKQIPKDKKHSFAKFRGVSMFYLNTLWEEIKQHKQFKEVHLYKDKATNTTVMWENHLPERRQGRYALVRKHNPGSVDSMERIPINQLEGINREDWEVKDIANYCIYPQLLSEEVEESKLSPTPMNYGSSRTFMNSVPQEHIGKEYNGMYLIYDHSDKFGDIIQALKKFCKEEDLFNLDTYVFIKLFSLDLRKIRLVASGTDQYMVREYKKLLKKDLPFSIEQFDQTLIYFGNWERPKVLSHLLPLWEAYQVFRNEEQTMTIITNDYESIHEKVWGKKENENLFARIETLDFSRLEFNINLERETILEECTNFTRGFKTLRDTIDKGFTRALALDVEVTVNQFTDLATEATMNKLCSLLLVAGKFTYHRGEYNISQSYFNQAISALEQFQVEEYLNGLNFDNMKMEDDLEKPMHFTKSFVHSTLLSLVTGRLGYAKTALKQFHQNRGLELIQSARDAVNLIDLKNQSEKNDLLIECDLVRAEYYAEMNNPDAAIEKYQTAELTWKVLENKAERVIRISYELGLQYKKSSRLKEAQTVLKSAYDKHVDLLSTQEKQQDVFLADIVTALGDVNNKLGKGKQAIKHYTDARRIVYTAIGTCNERVGKLSYLIGNCYGKIGDFDMALESFTRAIKVFCQCQGKNTLETAFAYSSQGAVYEGLKKPIEQEMCYREALNVARAVEQPASFKRQYLLIATYCIKLANVLKGEERYTEADPLYTEAFQVRKRELGEDHADTKRAQQLKKQNLALIPY